MKNSLLICVLMVFGMTGVWAQSPLDKPLAVVRLTKTEQIGSRFFMKQMEMFQKQMNTPLDATKKRQLLETRVDSILLEQAAERDKIAISDSELAGAIAQQRASVGQQISEDAFKKLVEQQTGFTWEEYSDSIRERMVQEKYLLAKRPQLSTQKFPVSDSEINDVYESQQGKFVSPILISFTFLNIDTRNKDSAAKAAAKQKMEEFSKQIKTGGQASFDDLVKKALDTTLFNSGNSGYIMKTDPTLVGTFGKPFVDTIFAMNVNAISGVLETNSGYFILMITDKRAARLIGIDDPLFPGQKLTPREQIRQLITSQKQNEAVSKALDEILKDLRKQAEISYFEKNFGW